MPVDCVFTDSAIERLHIFLLLSTKELERAVEEEEEPLAKNCARNTVPQLCQHLCCSVQTGSILTQDNRRPTLRLSEFAKNTFGFHGRLWGVLLLTGLSNKRPLMGLEELMSVSVDAQFCPHRAKETYYIKENAAWDRSFSFNHPISDAWFPRGAWMPFSSPDRRLEDVSHLNWAAEKPMHFYMKEIFDNSYECFWCVDTILLLCSRLFPTRVYLKNNGAAAPLQ